MNIILCQFGIYYIDKKELFTTEEFLYEIILNDVYNLTCIELEDLKDNNPIYEQKLKDKELFLQQLSKYIEDTYQSSTSPIIRILTLKDFIHHLLKFDYHIIEKFQVYYQLRNRNLIIKLGKSFGIDYLVYENDKAHSDYVIKCIFEETLPVAKLLQINRVAKNMNKKILIIKCNVTSLIRNPELNEENFRAELIRILDTKIIYLCFS